MCRVSFAICATMMMMALISATRAANADLFVAADNTADLYVNGNRLSKTFDWQGYVRYTINVRVGDVIAVEAEDLGGGRIRGDCRASVEIWRQQVCYQYQQGTVACYQSGKGARCTMEDKGIR